MSMTSPVTTTSDAAEQHEAVGVTVGRGLVQHLDALVVHAQRLRAA